MKYKNLYLAYSFEILIGIITSTLIILFGPLGMSFYALFTFRYFILEKEPISSPEAYWYETSVLMKKSLIIISVLIISVSVLLALISQGEFSSQNRNIGFLLTIPIFTLIHGILGTISQKK